MEQTTQDPVPLDRPVRPGIERVPGYDETIINRDGRVLETARGRVRADARHALTSDRSVPLACRHPEFTRRALEVVIGTDDRVEVADTTQYPWRCICALDITAADGTEWNGTGWLVGPRLVVTAGHVVYMANRGGWVRSIVVAPGQNGTASPFGSVMCHDFRSVSGWTTGSDERFDYGAILLPANQAIGNQIGYFGLSVASSAWLDGLAASLSGYPSDKTSGTQWYHARRIAFSSNHTLYYNIDTAGGQSGSPVWVNYQGVRYVVGIHTGGAVTGNSAVRVTNNLSQNLFDWNVP